VTHHFLRADTPILVVRLQLGHLTVLVSINPHPPSASAQNYDTSTTHLFSLRWLLTCSPISSKSSVLNEQRSHKYLFCFGCCSFLILSPTSLMQTSITLDNTYIILLSVYLSDIPYISFRNHLLIRTLNDSNYDSHPITRNIIPGNMQRHKPSLTATGS